MPKSDNQKEKLLRILNHLEQNTDEDHLLTAAALAAMLEREHGILCDRKTVISDIQTLQACGVDIVSVHGPKGGYYLASRAFELPEIKLLLSAVQSSRYLTEKKSRELTKKLLTLCSRHQAKTLLSRDMLVSGRVKSMNETIYYNVDAIQEAIARDKQISFRYFDWSMDGTRRYRDRDYTASPYGLCQSSENCYLLAHSPRHGATSYRVDRMENIRLLDTKRTPCPELAGKALAEYAGRLFQMYTGDPVEVKMRFHRSLTNVVIDRFGRDILLIPEDEDHFVFTAKVAVSPMFLSWVMGFGEKAKVLYPQSVVDSCKQLCQEVLAQYG